MRHRTLLCLTLLAAQAAQEQTRYDKASVPNSESQARSQNSCPWLTQGSASTALGGEVSMKVSVSDTGKSSCIFLRQGSRDSLEILVSKGPVSSCPAGSTELKGIGNQAARCRARGSHGGRVDMVSGRGRDLHFAVTRSSRGQKRAPKSPDVQEDALEQIAEQVAGNLF